MTQEAFRIGVRHRSPGEYTCWLDGVRTLADLLGYHVDAAAWGGGIPNFVTVTPVPAAEAPPEPVNPDIYERAAEEADNGAVEDIAGS